ncbi:MAG: alpha/beta fold hydrolase [Bacteroidetes bacterium]|nr:alpha/beta fold hydrolase [Bacteroidota bacterium]
MTPSSPELYKPSLLLRPCHIHTVYASKLRYVPAPKYVRERLETPDGDFLDLDWVRSGNQRVVIVLHGLEGSADRPYMRGMVRALSTDGWDVLALNFRSCSGEMNRKPYSYHSGATDDLSFIIDQIQLKYSTIAAIGFSLGGNVLLKYLGEMGLQTPVRAAVAFSVPSDLKGSSLALTRSENRLYMWNFLRLLKVKVLVKAEQFPDLVSADGFDKISSFQEFDDRYTAPLNGFKDAEDYWARCCSNPFIPDIRVPTLLVNALDDPFLSESCYPVTQTNKNPALTLERPRFGGHVGFQQKGQYWSESRAKKFLNEALRAQ